jgi:alkylation response protein AidB-like acyl-CoA dehydrogenase
VLEDWRSMGQRATVSGTTVLDNTPVDDDDVHHGHTDVTAQITPFVQLTHASIDVGIARGAFEDALTLARSVARPWVDAGVTNVGDEVHVIHRVGDLAVKLHAAEALLERTADLVDRARTEPRADLVLAARLAVAEAKTFATDVVLEISTALFEIGGTRSTSSDYALDRHWRNARTHTLHNPDRWLRHHLGNFALHGVTPPTNGKI